MLSPIAVFGFVARTGGRNRFQTVVALNHAIASAMVHGPATGLELLDAIKADSRLAGSHRLDAVRAHLLELYGDRQAAMNHYRAAATKTGNVAERNYLLTRAADLSNKQLTD